MLVGTIEEHADLSINLTQSIIRLLWHARGAVSAEADVINEQVRSRR